MKEDKITFKEVLANGGIRRFLASAALSIALIALVIAYSVNLYRSAGATPVFWTMLIISIIVTVLMIVFGFFLTTRYASRTTVADRLNAQLSSAANFYICLDEINITDNSVVPIYNANPAIAQAVNSCDHNMQELFYGIMSGLPDSPTKKAAIDFCNLTDPDSKFANSNTLTLEYFSYGNIWVRARYVVSRRNKSGHITHVLWMLENIDAEKRARDLALSRAEILNHQMGSIADIYMSVYDFDLTQDTFSDVKAANARVVGLIGENRSNGQQTLIDVMKQMVSPESLSSVLDFIDFSTLQGRLSVTDTITMEYQSSDGHHRRARFIASERSPAGRLLHVLWLVEEID